MKACCKLIIPDHIYRKLMNHLFPGDFGEHGAVIAAGIAVTADGYRLMARDLFLAEDGSDYTISDSGYHSLNPTFIHRSITYCRDQRLCYLAIHNHGGRNSVGFSYVDLESHERGYPALLDIASEMPVGALVFAKEAVQVDLWLSTEKRCSLKHADILGANLVRLRSTHKNSHHVVVDDKYNRQALLFGNDGQRLLKDIKIGVVGLGGVGSLVSEYLARLGVGSLILADPDFIENSNFSRIVGSRLDDLPLKRDPNGHATSKVSIAKRVARDANPNISIDAYADDFSREAIAKKFTDCDYIFLAADSMRSRLVFNALVHQYFIPGVQIGSKITFDRSTGSITDAFSVIRRVYPGEGCLLCNQLIDSGRLADEWKSDSERINQQYGIGIPNPSVITMNAVGAAHAVNEFLFYAVGLPVEKNRPLFRRFDHIRGTAIYDEPRKDSDCRECSQEPYSRYGMGDSVRLPCSQ